MELDELVSRITKNGRLSNAQKAVCFLWHITEFEDTVEDRRLPVSQLRKVIEHHNLGRPTNGSLLRTIPSLGLTYKRNDKLELKAGADETILEWLQVDAGATETPTLQDSVIDPEIFKALPLYLRLVFEQTNICYKYKCWDAVGVLLRRASESLLIVAFEKQNKSSMITKQDGDYIQFSDIVNRATEKTGLDLRRDAKKGIEQVKNISPIAAHGRFNNAHRNDFDPFRHAFRVLFEQLVNLAYS
jgi:hypothetical protein